MKKVNAPQLLQELEFLMSTDEGLEGFTALYSEIVHYCQETGDISLLTRARALIEKQVLYLVRRYKEEMPAPLAELAQRNGTLQREAPETDSTWSDCGMLEDQGSGREPRLN